MKLSFLILAHCQLSSKTPMRLEHQRGTAVSLYEQSPPKRADSIFLFLLFPPNRTMLKILLPHRGLILKDPRYLSLPIICRTKISQSKKKKKLKEKCSLTTLLQALTRIKSRLWQHTFLGACEKSLNSVTMLSSKIKIQRFAEIQRRQFLSKYVGSRFTFRLQELMLSLN